MPLAVPPPESLNLTNLSFDDLKTDIENVLNAIVTAHDFVDRFGWFIPQQYRSALDELMKIVVWAQTFLAKTP